MRARGFCVRSISLMTFLTPFFSLLSPLFFRRWMIGCREQRSSSSSSSSLSSSSDAEEGTVRGQLRCLASRLQLPLQLLPLAQAGASASASALPPPPQPPASAAFYAAALPFPPLLLASLLMRETSGLGRTEVSVPALCMLLMSAGCAAGAAAGSAALQVAKAAKAAGGGLGNALASDSGTGSGGGGALPRGQAAAAAAGAQVASLLLSTLLVTRHSVGELATAGGAVLAAAAFEFWVNAPPVR